MAQGWRGWRRRAEMAQAGMAVALRSHRGAAGAGMARRARRIGRLTRGRRQASKVHSRRLINGGGTQEHARTRAADRSRMEKARPGGGKEFEASEDRSKAERGGCDRRGFSARCQCIGMKETERYGTTLLSSAYHSLSMRCAVHTLFQMFSLIFCATASALWLARQASGRWPFVVSSQRAIEPHILVQRWAFDTQTESRARSLEST